MPSCGEIAAVLLDVDERQTNITDAEANICTLGRTIIARTHRGEQVALLEHERVRVIRATKVPSGVVEVELIERHGAPYCYIPTAALIGRAP